MKSTKSNVAINLAERLAPGLHSILPFETRIQLPAEWNMSYGSACLFGLLCKWKKICNGSGSKNWLNTSGYGFRNRFLSLHKRFDCSKMVPLQEQRLLCSSAGVHWVHIVTDPAALNLRSELCQTLKVCLADPKVLSSRISCLPGHEPDHWQPFRWRTRKMVRLSYPNFENAPNWMSWFH